MNENSTSLNPYDRNALIREDGFHIGAFRNSHTWGEGEIQES